MYEIIHNDKIWLNDEYCPNYFEGKVILLEKDQIKIKDFKRDTEFTIPTKMIKEQRIYSCNTVFGG